MTDSSRNKPDDSINPPAYLHNGAWHFVELARQDLEGSLYAKMAATTFAAFYLEAYLNWLGIAELPYWQDVERQLGPDQKLALLCHHLNLPMERSQRPWQSVRTLLRHRNHLAHATESGFHLLTELTIDEAERLLEDAEAIVKQLHQSAGLSETSLWIMRFRGFRPLGDE